MSSGKKAAFGAFAGLGVGIWIGGIMCVLGFVACLTGVGVVIGLPMILAGVVVPVLTTARGVEENLSPEELEELNRKSARLSNVGGLICLVVVLVGLVWLAWVVNG